MEEPALSQNSPIPSAELLELFVVQHAVTLAPSQTVEQKVAHFPGPGFVLLLGNEFEFAQMVLVAQGVRAIGVGEISFEMVVDDEVGAAGQNIKIVHGLLAPLGMNPIEGQAGVADDMQPMELARAGARQFEELLPPVHALNARRKCLVKG
jgi:hypothetical protein